VFLTYANPIYAYGAEKFFSRCEESGVDGVIIPDIPYEEREEMRPYSEPHHVAIVPLIAPTSRDRIQKIAKIGQGYIYIVSSLGVTGVRKEITTDISAIVEEIRKVTDVPAAVGFGIATPEQAYEMAKVSDGAIVGSAIVKLVEQYGEASPNYVYEYCKSMVEAVERASK
jgi:tryptophan synthase alpha chain